MGQGPTMEVIPQAVSMLRGKRLSIYKLVINKQFPRSTQKTHS